MALGGRALPPRGLEDFLPSGAYAASGDSAG